MEEEAKVKEAKVVSDDKGVVEEEEEAHAGKVGRRQRQRQQISQAISRRRPRRRLRPRT